MKNKRISAKVIASLVTMMLALTIVGNTTTSAHNPFGALTRPSGKSVQNAATTPYGQQKQFRNVLPAVSAQEETVYFEKTDYGSEQDCITGNVCITRGDQQGLYNAVLQSYFQSSGPLSTEWAMEECSPSTVFTRWVSAVGHYPPGSVDQPMCLHLTDGSNLYFNLTFLSWTAGGNGGGFSYERTPWSMPSIIANPDKSLVRAGESVEIDVLANDYVAEGLTLSIQSFTQPSVGNVTQLGEKLVYTPSAQSVEGGVDTFTYVASNGTDTSEGTVGVTLMNIQNATSNSTFHLKEGNLKFEGTQSAPLNWPNSDGTVGGQKVDITAKLGCSEIESENGECKVEVKTEYTGNSNDIANRVFSTPIHDESVRTYPIDGDLSQILDTQYQGVRLWGLVKYVGDDEYYPTFIELKRFLVRPVNTATVTFDKGVSTIKGKFKPIPEEFPVSLMMEGDVYDQLFDQKIEEEFSSWYFEDVIFERNPEDECIIDEEFGYPPNAPCYIVNQGPMSTQVLFGNQSTVETGSVDDYYNLFAGSLTFRKATDAETQYKDWNYPFFPDYLHVNFETFLYSDEPSLAQNQTDYSGNMRGVDDMKIGNQYNIKYFDGQSPPAKTYKGTINSSAEINYQDGVDEFNTVNFNQVTIEPLEDTPGVTIISAYSYPYDSESLFSNIGISEYDTSNKKKRGYWTIDGRLNLEQDKMYIIDNSQDVIFNLSTQGSYNTNWNPFETAFLLNPLIPRQGGYNYNKDFEVINGGEYTICDRPYGRRAWICEEDKDDYCLNYDGGDYQCRYCAYYSDDPRCSGETMCTLDSPDEECGCFGKYSTGIKCNTQYAADPYDAYFTPDECLTSTQFLCYPELYCAIEVQNGDPPSGLCKYCDGNTQDSRCFNDREVNLCMEDSSSPECLCFAVDYGSQFGSCVLSYCEDPANAEDPLCNLSYCDLNSSWVCEETLEDRELFCEVLPWFKSCEYCRDYGSDPRCTDASVCTVDENGNVSSPECACFLDEDGTECENYCYDTGCANNDQICGWWFCY